MFLKIQNLHWVEVACQLFIIPSVWLAYKYKHRLYSEVVESPWKMLSEGAMESYRAIGVMVGVTHDTSALLSFPGAENEAAQTLLFASLSVSVLAVSTSTSLLSAASYFDPAQLEHMWHMCGMRFVILLHTLILA